MKEKLILGISGSPRKDANTDTLLRIALDEADKKDGIRTEALYLRDYEIKPCISCFACCNEKQKDSKSACIAFNDGMDEIYPKLKECAGLLIATPVYFGSMTSQVKAFMDRTEGLLRYGSTHYKLGLRNKVGAGIAIGGNRNGGQEFTLQAIHYYFLVHDMVIIGTGPDITPGCYLGGAGTNSPQRGKVRNAVLNDELGIKSSQIIGRRMAEMVEILNK